MELSNNFDALTDNLRPILYFSSIEELFSTESTEGGLEKPILLD
jgi:hypothetical protein